MKCPHCGFVNENGTLFCTNCGMIMKTQKEIDEDRKRREEEQRKRKEEEEYRKLEELKERIRNEERQKEEIKRKKNQEQHAAQLKKKEDMITQLNNQLQNAYAAANKRKKKNKAMAVVVILLIGALSVWFYEMYDDLNYNYRRYRNNTQDMVEENNVLKKENQTLSKELDQINSFLTEDVLVNIVEIYNGDTDGNRIGEGLNSNEMRYLMVKYKVYAVNPELSQPMDFYIDIYNTDGELWQYSKSADNHTSPAQKVKSGGTDTWGFGNATKSIYQSGNYRIDIVYDGEIVASKICYIY